MRKLDFDLLRRRKIVVDGREYPVREKTVSDELGIVHGFRQEFRAIMERSMLLEPDDYEGKVACKRDEIDVMTRVIQAFCSIESDVLHSIPARAFNGLHAFVLSSGIGDDVFEVAEHSVCATFTDHGVEHQVKSVSVKDVATLYEYAMMRLSPAVDSNDVKTIREAMIDTVMICVPLPREDFYAFPDVALEWLMQVIQKDASGETEDDEKNG